MNLLAMARKKTKYMSLVTNELFYCQPKGEYTNKKREKAFAKLWDINMQFPDFAKVVSETGYTLEDYKTQCITMEKLGFNRDGEDYIPLAAISFAKPLRYMAENREEFADADDDTQRDMVREAMKILNDGYADNVVILKDKDD
mgnify:CR=1 FL=1